MEFLTAFPALHICEYNNRYTKKVLKEVNEISREHISQTLKVKLKGLTCVYKSKFASADVSLQKQHSFGDKNE